MAMTGDISEDFKTMHEFFLPHPGNIRNWGATDPLKRRIFTDNRFRPSWEEQSDENLIFTQIYVRQTIITKLILLIICQVMKQLFRFIGTQLRK